MAASKGYLASLVKTLTGCFEGFFAPGAGDKDGKLKQKISFGAGGYDFGAPVPISAEAVTRVNEILSTGRLFRYQGLDDVAVLEKSVAEYLGVPYVVACNSGGCGLFLALKALGVKSGDKVLVNTWTLAPVPGAIVHAGAQPVFVEMSDDTFTLDLDDLERKAKESGAKVLMMSYMRGNVPDMDKLLAKVKSLGLSLVEDCAHTLGATWQCDGEDRRRHIGTFGDVGVWSLQTNKSINSGEGGVISTNRQDIASFITIATGSYGHFALNGSSGSKEYSAEIYPTVPNFSMRMTTLAAAIALPQLKELPERVAGWRRNALVLREMFMRCPHTRCRTYKNYESGKEEVVMSSIQFEVFNFTPAMKQEMQDELLSLGIPVAVFGGAWKGFTSTLKDWKFADATGEQHRSLRTPKFLDNLIDIPLYHTYRWPVEAIEEAARIIEKTITGVAARQQKVQGA